jgi:hypothetical protein
MAGIKSYYERKKERKKKKPFSYTKDKLYAEPRFYGTVDNLTGKKTKTPKDGFYIRGLKNLRKRIQNFRNKEK